VTDAAALARADDETLLESVQRQSFRYFWEGAHASGLALDRRRLSREDADDKVATGGTGFGVMAIVVAAERGWISRGAALERLARITTFLRGAQCWHGVFSHFVNGTTGEAIPFMPGDDAADLVETSFLCMGLLCVREYFQGSSAAEARLRDDITALWEQVQWSWHTRGGRDVLFWHWSPRHRWAVHHRIRGWNECLITYVLAASAPRHRVDPGVYHHGFARGPVFRNRHPYYGIELPLGPAFGGPLFFAHYSFCGIDPRELTDRYANYWRQNVHHVRINHAHCRANPLGHAGYGEACWGLTASDDPQGYSAHAPDNDNGTITPTAALSSFPYAPREAMQALRHFLTQYGERLWSRYGFADAFCPAQDWFADTVLAIDQGPIILMIENYRSGLLWRLFMRIAEVRAGLARLGFASPALASGEPR